MKIKGLVVMFLSLVGALACDAERASVEPGGELQAGAKARMRGELAPPATVTVTKIVTTTSSDTATSTTLRTVTLTSTETRTLTQTATVTTTATATTSTTASQTVTGTTTLVETQTTTGTRTVTAVRTDTSTATLTATQTLTSVLSDLGHYYLVSGTVTATDTAIAYWTSWTRTGVATATSNTTATTTSSNIASGTASSIATRTVTNPYNGTETKTVTGSVTASGVLSGTFTVTLTANGTTPTTGTGVHTYNGTGTRTVTATGSNTGNATQSWTYHPTGTVTQTLTTTATQTDTATQTTTLTGTRSSVGTVTQTVTVTNTASSTTSATESRTSTYSQSATATQTGTDTGVTTVTLTSTATQTGTVTLTLTDTGTSDAGWPGPINSCLAHWRATSCGQSCLGETQADRMVCQQFLDCYRDHACSPSSCGEADQACGVNQFSAGTAPKTVADQVYACLGCPAVVVPGDQQCLDQPDGLICNDGNGCTQTDFCLDGVCVGIDPPACEPTDGCHTTGTCQAPSGTCSYPTVPDGTDCGDGAICSNGACITPPFVYTVQVTVLRSDGGSVAGLPVYALNGNGKAFFTGVTGPNGVAAVTVDDGTYYYGADISTTETTTSVRSSVPCAAPLCTQVVIDASAGPTFPVVLAEGKSNGELGALGNFVVTAAAGERLVDAGSMPAGTTIRVGTYHADGDLPGAYAIGDTLLALYETKSDGSQVKLAENDDAGDPARVGSEDVRGASYISFTTARTAHLSVGVTCKSERCRVSLQRKADVDSNGGLGDVAAALRNIDARNGHGQRHKLNFQPGTEGWFRWIDEYDEHFQGVQRLRQISAGLKVNSQHAVLSASGDGDLFMIQYFTPSPDPDRLGPQRENGSGGKAISHSTYANYEGDHTTDHLGGIQAFGHYLGGGFDGNNGQGLVMHWDVNGQTPIVTTGFVPGKNASAVGIAKLTGQNAPIVMVMGGPDTAFVRVLRKPPNRWGYANPAQDTAESRWVPDTTDWPEPDRGKPALTKMKDGVEFIVEGTLDVSTDWPYPKQCCRYDQDRNPYDCLAGSYCGTTRQTFQALQLLVKSHPVTHAASALYLVGAYASEQGTADFTYLETGTDEVTLYELLLSRDTLAKPVDETPMGLVAKTRQQLPDGHRMVFACAYDGPRQCSFNASFGIFVDPDSESLSAYSSRAWRPDHDLPITITEFGPPVAAAGDDEVVLCTDANFGSYCSILTLAEGFFPQDEGKATWPNLDMSPGISNDWTSSLRVGKNVTLVAFNQSEFRFNTTDRNASNRDWRIYESGDYPNLGDFENRISSAIVRPRNQAYLIPRRGEVTVCTEPGGDFLCVVLKPGDYPKPAGPSNRVDGTGGSFGLPNDWMSLVILPPGGKITLFRDDDFNGQKVELSNTGTSYQNVSLADKGIDNAVSSVKVLAP